jgi:hypothetical protein
MGWGSVPFIIAFASIAVSGSHGLCACCGFAAFALLVMAPSVAEVIKGRAETIRSLGAFVGFFEFMVWGQLRERVVHMLFGDNLVNLANLFGRPLANIGLDNDCHVAAVSLVAGGDLRTAPDCGSGVNHFVIAVPIVGSVPVASKSRSAAVAARKAGFALKLTDATGDCGIDAMTFFDGVGRTSASFGTLREELADFMVGHCDNLVWQEVFGLCAEAGGVPPPAGSKPNVPDGGKGGMGPSTSSSTSSASCSSASSSSALVGSSPSSGLEGSGPSSGLVGSSPSSGMVSSAALLGPAPLPPPVEEPPRAEDPPPAVVAGSFVEWLAARPNDELTKMVVDYKTFKAAETKWLERHPRGPTVIKSKITKKRANTSVLFRHATATAYTAWRDGPGATSTCPLKVLVHGQSTFSWTGYSKQKMVSGFPINITPTVSSTTTTSSTPHLADDY